MESTAKGLASMQFCMGSISSLQSPIYTIIFIEVLWYSSVHSNKGDFTVLDSLAFNCIAVIYYFHSVKRMQEDPQEQ